MTYLEFRDTIVEALEGEPAGLTWKELRDGWQLPYKTPCPEWVARLEEEVGLVRERKRGNAKLWVLVKTTQE